MKVPILTYHSMNIGGADYASNDLVALREDLPVIEAAGFRILPLVDLVERWLAGSLEDEPIVGLACDDGSDFDYRDLVHPVAGPQRSVLNTLRDFRAANPDKQRGLSITSFVIASPEARAILDTTCMIGRGWWNDEWWRDAAATGLMGVANHSWDHNHATLPSSPHINIERGTFHSIATEQLADFEIAQASRFLRERAPNPAAALFAYPYGEPNAFLVENYFPRRAPEIGVMAAFTHAAEPLTRTSMRWELPRFMCGRDWKSPLELARLLRDTKRVSVAPS
jgi:hypothetical protein